jgi:hypothetical protein
VSELRQGVRQQRHDEGAHLVAADAKISDLPFLYYMIPTFAALRCGLPLMDEAFWTPALSLASWRFSVGVGGTLSVFVICDMATAQGLGGRAKHPTWTTVSLCGSSLFVLVAHVPKGTC